MFLNPSHAVYWLMSRGIPFPLCMYAFITWIISHCWTIKWHQRTSRDCRTSIVIVTFYIGGTTVDVLFPGEVA